MRKLIKNFIYFLERWVLPLATTMAKWRWLVALRDAFISVMPISIVGSLTVLIPGLINAAKTELGLGAVEYALTPVINISNLIYQGTFQLFSLYFALAWGYQLARSFEVNRLAGAITSLGCYLMSIANVVKLNINGDEVSIKNAFNTSQLSSLGLFTSLIFGAVGLSIFILMTKARLTLRFSSYMPHAEEAAFIALIPMIISLSIVGAINYIFQMVTGTYFGNWLLNTIQNPLTKMGQGFGIVLLITFLLHAFYFFGINGMSVLVPVIDSIWLTPQNANLTAVKSGHVVHYLGTRNSFDVYSWIGGTGDTLVLILLILLISKRSDFRTLAKIAIGPGFFNINDPIVWGLPLVLNPLYLIPFILAPLANVTLAYWATAWHLVEPVSTSVPNVIPPFLNAFLATNYDWRALVLVAVNVIVAILIWLPFVLAGERIAKEQEKHSLFSFEY